MPDYARDKSSAAPLGDVYTDSPSSGPFTSLIHLSTLSTPQNHETSSPYGFVRSAETAQNSTKRRDSDDKLADPSGFDDWDEEWEAEDDGLSDMPSDLRSHQRRPSEAMRSQQPLLSSNGKSHGYDEPTTQPEAPTRRRTFHEADPEELAAKATRTRYMYAGFFLVLCLVSFVVQTETAVYIAEELQWKKSYCML
jgi:hypothetical protein